MYILYWSYQYIFIIYTGRTTQSDVELEQRVYNVVVLCLPKSNMLHSPFVQRVQSSNTKYYIFILYGPDLCTCLELSVDHFGKFNVTIKYRSIHYLVSRRVKIFFSGRDHFGACKTSNLMNTFDKFTMLSSLQFLKLHF